MKTISAALIAVTCVALSGCGNPMFRSGPFSALAHIITMDAKQRAVLAAKRTLKTESTDGTKITKIQLRFCAEPSPDVFSVIAQAASAEAGFGKTANPKAIEATLKAAFSSAEQGSTIPRTQTINMLREMMYRTCERYLNGGINETELALQAVRDQRLMVSILAIEQLAGVITTKPVVIGASSVAQAATHLDDHYKKEVQEKTRILEEKEKAYGDLKCDDEANKDNTPCKEAGKAHDDAQKEKDDAQKRYEELREAMAVMAKTIVMTPPSGGLDGGQSEAIAAIAPVIQEIVRETFKQDEFLLFCLKAMDDATKLDAVQKKAVLTTLVPG